jgi:hypothetical protein
LLPILKLRISPKVIERGVAGVCAREERFMRTEWCFWRWFIQGKKLLEMGLGWRLWWWKYRRRFSII